MIKELNNQELDNFISGQKYSQFLQSSAWNKFQKDMGNKIWQIGYIEKDEILAIASITQKKLFLNYSYLYLARGPIIADQVQDKNKYLKLILKAIRDLSIETKEMGEVFFRFEPIFNFDLENIKQVKDFQPSRTLLLDLTKLEKELSAQLHQKTRYNIKLAQKKGVKIELIQDKELARDIFFSLISKTSARNDFTAHHKKYYAQMLALENFNLWIAKHEQDVLAANIVVSFGDTVTYLHGASANQKRNLMAPHLLQWEQIEWAKSQGYQLYDFWGISPVDQPKHKWAGFTRFKKGFGGEEKKLPGTFDLVYNQKIYSLYKVLKKFI